MKKRGRVSIFNRLLGGVGLFYELMRQADWKSALHWWILAIIALSLGGFSGSIDASQNSARTK